MKKLIVVFFALSVLFLTGGLVNNAFAELQVDRGQEKSAAKRVFFVARYARTNALATSGNVISTDRVVVWDSVSDDGVTVDMSTTSHDALVVGVTLDEIPGSSRDNSTTLDLNYSNWGRILVYGRVSAVSWDQSMVDTNSVAVPIGSRVSVSARNAGAVGAFRQISSDVVNSSVSRDSFGVLLDSPAAGDKTADIFVKNL